MRWPVRAALLTAAILAVTAAADSPRWREDASRLDYDSTLHLHWANSMGDWLDADGKPMGAKPFGAADAPGGNKPVKVEIDVTGLVRAHGADFRVNTVGGFSKLASRESPGGDGPVLLVTRGGRTTTLKASADTYMDVSTYRPIGDRPTMLTHYGALIRFDQAADPAITRAVLELTSLNRFGRPQRFLVFRPTVLAAPAAVAAGATYAAPAPDRLRANPRTAGLLTHNVAEPRGGPTATVFDIKGAAIKPRPNSRVVGDTMEAWFEGNLATAVDERIPLPGARTEAYLTVVVKLSADWTAPGGKMPGLSNTGNVPRLSSVCIVNGVPMLPGGWGGRSANACHWSARTIFRGVRDGSVGGGTYLYALSPKDVNGVADYWSLPYPKGRWFAYVEHVKLNTPGHGDGEIGYWLVDRKTAPNGKRVEAAGGIIYRDTAQPQSAINEIWANVYCGGHDCGAQPWPRSTVSLKRLTVTVGLPDLRAVQAEVDRLNGEHA